MYVQLAINMPAVSGVFDYHVPQELSEQIQPGCLVEAPFGKQKVQGIVLRVVAEPAVQETRPVTSLLDPLPVLTPVQMALAARVAEVTLSSPSLVLHSMLPPGLNQQADALFSASPDLDALTGYSGTALEKRILDLVRTRGPLRGRQLDTAIPRLDWRPAARSLVRKGLLVARPILPPPGVRPRTVRTAHLSCSPESVKELLPLLGRKEAGARRLAILEYLARESLPVAVPWIYAATGGNLQDLYELSEKGFIALGEEDFWRDPLDKIDPAISVPHILNQDQEVAWKSIRDGIHAAPRGASRLPYLLDGVTGSGKTEIYLRAVEETLTLGRQAIILVPEISLTPQTVQRFLSRFPGRVGLIHSRLSPGERYDTWRRLRLGKLPIAIGPRSALFSPLADPGLIVIDECHDDSYYQTENQPYYNAINVALEYARVANSVILFGTATPSVELLYRSENENWHRLHLPRRIIAVTGNLAKTGSPPAPTASGQNSLPSVEIVDMRQELKAGNRSIFSRSLKRSLSDVLSAGQQAILFLNRRGYTTFIFCRDCGNVVRCPRCDLPLSLHLEDPGLPAAELVCHTCGYHRHLPHTCPLCGSHSIGQYGTGTEKVEREIKSLFPHARVVRWDAGTTRKKGSHDLLLSHFTHHQADILVGTQMVAKSLDLPLVTLVGVVLADIGLSFPDFRAAERTFQLLTQVVGRAGRSQLGGRAILQTYQPENPAIRMAAKHDTDGFYRYEIEQRKKLAYPPFSRMVRLEVRHFRSATVESAAERYHSTIERWLQEDGLLSTEIIGPAPCFFHRQGGIFRWHIILRGPDPARLFKGRSLEPPPGGSLRIQVDPPTLL